MIKGLDLASLRQGFFFGLNSGVVTTTGLLAGISQTSIKPVFLIASIVSLAISDGASEAFGLYVSKKAQDFSDKTQGPLLSMISLFFTKFFIVLSFLLPFIFTKSLKHYKNLMWPIIWSLILLAFLDYNLSKEREESFFRYYIPHILVVVFVMFSSRYFGKLLNKLE